MLAEVLGIERLTEAHAEWIEAPLHAGEPARVPGWSESLAVGAETAPLSAK